MTSYCGFYFWAPCKTGISHNPLLHFFICLNTTVIEFIGQRFILGYVIESADLGPARWGWQPLVFGHTRRLQATGSEPSQRTDLEARVWTVPYLGLNQHSPDPSVTHTHTLTLRMVKMSGLRSLDGIESHRFIKQVFLNTLCVVFFVFKGFYNNLRKIL